MSVEDGQLALDLPLRTALGRRDFLVAPANREALAFLDRWPDWPAHAAILQAPPGAGKSHLAAVWRAHSGARELRPEKEAIERLLCGASEAPAWLLEDVDRRLERDGDSIEELLFHLLNHLSGRAGALLMTARAPLAEWRVELADLVSRLKALPQISIAPPDDDLLAAVMLKLFADRQLRIDPAVPTYLLGRIERSFAAVVELVEVLDRTALARRRAVTLPLAREVLETWKAKRSAP
ncbi:MAG: DNA replication protein [Alphaproteobacteria bacterium]|nr:MAG: DNA replication protein [Alphaproteobacteria bacterium]